MKFHLTFAIAASTLPRRNASSPERPFPARSITLIPFRSFAASVCKDSDAQLGRNRSRGIGGCCVGRRILSTRGIYAALWTREMWEVGHEGVGFVRAAYHTCCSMT